MLPYIIAIAVMGLAFLIANQLMNSNNDKHKKTALDRIHRDTEASLEHEGRNVSIIKEKRGDDSFIRSLPFLGDTYDLMLKSGLEPNIGTILLYMAGSFLIAFLFLNYLVLGNPLFSLIGAIFAAIFIPRAYLQRRVAKRNLQFINQFPDAIDMIVRSVKSGHPINAAFRMIAENMSHPVSTEFQKVVDEVAYGRSLPEALKRMASRIQEPDANFFVVVLSVQQETGGNLAEVLTNLSNVIRKRKQLRLKIRALTAEGRASAWVVGFMPVIVAGLIHLVNPEYLRPLWETDTGRMWIWISAGLIFCAVFVIRKMLNVKV